MSPRLFPRTDDTASIPVQDNPNGSRVFRVTDRTIDQRSRLIIAADPEAAVEPDASAIAQLGREVTHEIVECRELTDQGTSWHSPPEVQP